MGCGEFVHKTPVFRFLHDKRFSWLHTALGPLAGIKMLCVTVSTSKGLGRVLSSNHELFFSRNLNGYRLAGSVEGLIVKVSEEHGKQKATVYSGRPHPPPPPIMAAHAPPPPQFYYPANDYGYDSHQRHRGGGPYRGGRGGGPRVERWSDRPSSSNSYGGGVDFTNFFCDVNLS